MPDSMSEVALPRQYGAEVILTPGILMAQAVARAKEITEQTPGAINLDQFSTPATPALHRHTTGPEIWNDSRGSVDALVSAVGTGGTITGIGEFLKEHEPEVKVIAVGSNGCRSSLGPFAGSHQMPGIGVGFIPAVLNRKLVDEVIAVSDSDAFACPGPRTRRRRPGFDHIVFIFRPHGKIVCYADGIDTGRKTRIICHRFNPLAVDEHRWAMATERFPILGRRHQHDARSSALWWGA